MDPQGNGDLTGSDDNERKKVALLRSLVERQDPAAQEVDNLMLRRFLRARDLDIEKASGMFLKYLKWRREAVPNRFISDAEVQNELIQKKVFMQGFDKMGRPIVVCFAARHHRSKRDMDEFKRFVVYVLDNICARIPSGHEKFVGIADLQGWGYSNCDIRAYIAALDILQNNYPERLGKVLLIHVPYIFMKAWKIIYPFIDDNTKKKFVFVEDKKLRATLLEDMDESQLPEIYGGKLPLVSIEDSAN
ncbi:SEC14 cytosolic factor [Cocos nucifera]|nr:SEC14 cytosolic factor [Cocos nucifera]